MDPKHDIDDLEPLAADTAEPDSPSVDDFIRELEAKESELDISSEMVIEVEESEFDDKNIPDFVMEEVRSQATGPQAASGLLENLRGQIAALNTEISRMHGERLELVERSHARDLELVNLKERTERERRETFTNQMCNLAAKMLPVLDNLDRALDFAMQIPEDKRAEFEQFFDGIVLVNQHVNEVFAGMGVQPIVSVGEMFDPHFHEAMATEETDRVPKNTITDELLRGYRIGDRVVRHSMVRVASSRNSDETKQGSETHEQDLEPAGEPE